MILLPDTAPAPSARADEWTDYLGACSDDDLCQALRASISQGQECVHDMVENQIVSRFTQRVIHARNIVKLSPAEVHIQPPCSE